jgi:cytochrome d ubiquinol oxidase subunit I
MDAVLLARIQFGFSAGFHFLFPPTTLGLTFIIFILESVYLKSKKELFKKLSDFLIKILALIFVIGVATGITLEFAFGTNWSEYSRMVGDIFGAPLAAEGIFAFFMESIFLGILVFGRKKVSGRFFWISSFMVFFGSHLSGLWIIIANSFMQTPAGFKIFEGRAVLTDFFRAAVNHSTIVRYAHTLLAGWITGSLLTAGISAWYLLKNKYREYAEKLLVISLAVFAFSGLVQLFSGHQHSVQVARTQPEKLAAFEGLWQTQKHAPLSLFGIPNEKEEKTGYKIGIDGLLSLLVYGDADREVKGLTEFPKEERPPIYLPFVSYHIMIMIGMLFVALAIMAGFSIFSRKLREKKWFLGIFLFSVPLPHIANELGWIAAEVGRQPWAVYRVLKTSQAASVVVPAGQILFTLLMFLIIYSLIFVVFMKILLKLIKRGPLDITTEGYG